MMFRFTRLLALTFSTLLLFQSCRVYHKKTVTVEEAVLSNKRVMVKDINDRDFKFKELRKEGDQLYGLAKKKSSTAKKLNQVAIEIPSDDKYVKIPISDNRVREYRLHNKTLSTILTFAFPLILLGSLALIPAKGPDYEFDLGL